MKHRIPYLFIAILTCQMFFGCKEDNSNPASSTTSTVTGIIYRSGTAIPVEGATVSVGDISGISNKDGQFQLQLPPGTYQIVATHLKYKSFKGTLTITSLNPTTYNSISMKYIPFQIVGDTVVVSGGNNWSFAAGLGSKIYFASPNNSSSAQIFLAFDLLTNTYSSKNISNNPLCACGYMSQLVTVSNKLYYFANDGAKYDPQTDQWTSVNYPYANHRGEPGIGVLGTDIYVVGGRGPLNTCQVYNTITDSWKTIANYPYSTSYTAVVSHNNKVYVLGGSGSSNKMLMYDPTTDSWSVLADIPFSNSYGGEAVVFNNKIIYKSNYDIFIYDLTSSTWDTANYYSPTYGYMVLANNSVYVVGGSSSSKPGFVIFKYVP
jgi:hypothetical protein